MDVSRIYCRYEYRGIEYTEQADNTKGITNIINDIRTHYERPILLKEAIKKCESYIPVGQHKKYFFYTGRHQWMCDELLDLFDLK